MAVKPQAPAAVGVNIGSLDFYSGGFGIPAGKFALEFNAVMYQAKNAQGVNQGPPRLGVMVRAHSLTDAAQRGENAIEQFYSMGGSADKSFAPNPDTGKGFVPVPGGPATSLNHSTNWFMLLKSLYDCGLPQGVFINDLSTIDGVHVATAQVPEPEERKGFQSATSEAQPLEQRKDRKVSIVVEILDDGKPWEGTGGIPEAGAAVKVGAKTPAKVPVKPAAAKAPAPAAASTTDEADLLDMAENVATSVIEASPDKMNKLKLKSGMFSKAKEMYGDDITQEIQSKFCSTDEALQRVLDKLGYKIVGSDVKPA